MTAPLPFPARLAQAMSSQRLRTPLAAAAVLLALGLGTTAVMHARAQGTPAAAAAKPALTVTVATPQPATMARTLAAGGTIAAWQEASVGAEANGYRLAEVRVNVGDRVRRGQPLAVFAPEMARADVAQARASVAEAQAALAEAAANAQRARELDKTGALSAQQVAQWVTGEQTAQARLEAARAQLQVHELRLAQTQVLAPDDGVISVRTATVGAVVPAGQELFRLIRKGRLEWRAEVPASDLATIRPGQAVQVVPAGGGTLAGTVRMVAPTVDAATRNGLIYVDLPAPPAASDAPVTKAGMYARGEFAIGTSAALTLPQTAVLLRDGFSYVFKVAADGKVSQAKVTIGRRSGDRIELTSGLDAKDRVVASGGAFLADGDLVRVVDAPPKAPIAATAAAPASTVRR